MTALLAFIASALLELAGTVMRPTSATCPRGFWLATGVQRGGSFACWYDPLTDDTDTAPREHPQRPVIRGKVWCVAGQPRVDGVRVFCSSRAGEEPRS